MVYKEMFNLKVVTCIGYHGTGSSAIDDLFREFDNFAEGPYEYESRFIQDPDGIRDLEYNLIDNPHRLNSGYALKRYLNYCKKFNRLYKKIYGKDWLCYSKNYISSLTTCKYKGYWQSDILLLSWFRRNFYYFRRLINKFLPKYLKKPVWYNYFPRLDFYHSFIDRNQFYEKTKEYTKTLFRQCNKDDKEFLFLDQLVPTMNISNYLNYVDDLKVIIVDRDPRDSFISHKRGKDHVIPLDAENYCKIFIDLRKNLKDELSDKIMYIYFEDLIYDYENSVKKIVDFVGTDLSHHINKGSRFVVENSKKNTKLWLKHPEYSNEIKYIEEHLSKYLYNYKE